MYLCHLQQALEIGRRDEKRLLEHKKLVLLVDLDQTLLHTTNDNIPSNLKVNSYIIMKDSMSYNI